MHQDLFEKREKSGELAIHGLLRADRHGNTALHRVAAAGEVEKVQKLINEARRNCSIASLRLRAKNFTVVLDFETPSHTVCGPLR
jgi:hypothetical protein